MQLGNIIIVKKNGDDGKKFPLFDHSEYKIGSALDCHIRIALVDNKDQHICTIRKNKNGKPCIEMVSNSIPVSLNGDELKSSKFLQTGDLIELAGKKFKWESQIFTSTKTPGRIVKKSVPKITRRRSLNDFRVMGRKSIRQSFGHLRTWEETNEDESTKKLSSPNKNCSTSPTKPIVASKGSTRQSEIFISDTPMKPSEPNKTDEFNKSLKRTSTRKSLKPKVEKTPKTKKSPAEVKSANVLDEKPESVSGKRSKSATKTSRIPTKKYFESHKIERANMKFFGTPLKFNPVSKVRKFSSPDKSPKTLKSVKTPKGSQKTPKTTEEIKITSKTPKKLGETPKISNKTPKSVKTPNSLSSKTPKSLSSKTPKSSLSKTPKSTPRIKTKLSKTPNSTSKLLKVVQNSAEKRKLTKSASKIEKLTFKTPTKVTKTPRSVKKLVKTPKSAEKLSKTPKTIEKLSKTPKTTEKLPRTPKTVEKSIKTPKTIDKSIKTPKTIDKSIKTPKTVDKSIKTPKTIDKSIKTPKTIDKSIKTPKTIDKSIKTPKTVEKTVKTPRTIEKSVKMSKCMVKLIKTPQNAEKLIKTPKSMEKIIKLSKSAEKLIKTPKNASKSPSKSPGKLRTPISSVKRIRTPKSLQILKSSSKKLSKRSERVSLDFIPTNIKIKSPKKLNKTTDSAKKLLKTPDNTPAKEEKRKSIKTNERFLTVRLSDVKNTPTPKKNIKLKVSPKIKIRLSSPVKKTTPKSSKKTPKSVLTESNRASNSNKKSSQKIKIHAVKENITPPDSGSTSPENGVKTPENFMLKPLATPESIKAVKSAMKKDASIRKSLSTQGHSKKRKLSDITGEEMINKKIKLSSPLIIDGNIEYTPNSPRVKSNKAFSEPRPILNREYKTNLPSTVGRMTISHRSTPRAIWTNQRVSTDTPTLPLEEELVEYSPVSKNQDDNIRNLSFNDKDLSGIEKISNDSDLNIIETSPKQSNILNLSNRSTRSLKFNESYVPLIDFVSPGPSKTSTVTKKKKSVSLIDFTSPKPRKNTRLSKSAQSAQKNISVISVEVHTPEPLKALNISRSRKSSQRTPVQFHTVLSDKYENITPEPNTPTRTTRFSSQNNSSMFVQYDEKSIARSVNSTKSRSSRKFNNSRNSTQEDLFDISQMGDDNIPLSLRKSLSQSGELHESTCNIIEETRIDSPNKSKRRSQNNSDLETSSKGKSNRSSRLSKTTDDIENKTINPSKKSSKNKTSLDSTLEVSHLSTNSPAKLQESMKKLSKTFSRNSSQITTSSDMSPLNLSDSSTSSKSQQKLSANTSKTLNNSSMVNTSRKSPRKSLNNTDKTNVSFNHIALDTSKGNISVLSTRSKNQDVIEMNSLNDSVKSRSSSKKFKSPVNDLSNVSNVKKLFDTKTPNNDLTKIFGVKSLFKTPKVQQSPLNDLSDVKGVKSMYRTPKRQRSPENDLTDVQGVKKLLKTPRLKETAPKNDLTDIRGVKELIKGYRNSPRNDLTDVKGIKSLFKRKQRSPKNDLTNVIGVKKIMRTPRHVTSPINDLTNVSGVQKLFKVTGSPKNDLEDVRGVKRLFGEASVKDSYLNVSDMNMLFDELKSNETEDSFQIIDRLNNSPVRTYERKAKSVSPQKKDNETRNNRLSVYSSKKPAEINKWIEEQKKYTNDKKSPVVGPSTSKNTPLVEPSSSKNTPRESRRKQKVTQNTPVINESTKEIIEVNTRSRKEKLIEKLITEVIEIDESPRVLRRNKRVEKSDTNTPSQVIQEEVVNSKTRTRGRKREPTTDVETPKVLKKSSRTKKALIEEKVQETPKEPVIDSTVDVDMPASVKRNRKKDLQEETKESPRFTSRRAKVNIVENSTRGKKLKEQLKINENQNHSNVASPVAEQEIVTSVTIKQTTRRLKGAKNNVMVNTVEILEVLDNEDINKNDKKQVQFDVSDDEKNKKSKATKTTKNKDETVKKTRSTRSRSESDVETVKTTKGRSKKVEEPKLETPVEKRTRSTKKVPEPVEETEDSTEKEQVTPVKKKTRTVRNRKDSETVEEIKEPVKKGRATRSKKVVNNVEDNKKKTSVKNDKEEVQETEAKKPTKGRKLKETKNTEEPIEEPVKRGRSTKKKPEENKDEPKEVKVDNKRKNTRSKITEKLEEPVEDIPKPRGRKAQTTKTKITTEDKPVKETKSRRRKIDTVEEEKLVELKKQKVEETPTRVTRSRRK